MQPKPRLKVLIATCSSLHTVVRQTTRQNLGMICFVRMSSAIRERLTRTLRTDPDLDAFCLDFFRTVFDRFSSGMDRVSKVNLLLTLEEAEKIGHRLDEWTRRHSPEVVVESPLRSQANKDNPQGGNTLGNEQGRNEIIRRITDILAGAQNPTKPVSQILVECLSLAHDVDDAELADLCQGELEGWCVGSENEIQRKGLSHRLIDVYICLGNFAIDLDVAQARFRDEDALFDYFRSDQDFKYQRFFLDMPVASLERRTAKTNSSKGLAVYRFQINANHLLKNAKPTDIKFVAYAKSDSVNRLLESIRQRLIKCLIRSYRITKDSRCLGNVRTVDEP